MGRRRRTARRPRQRLFRLHAGENPFIIHPNRGGATNGLGNLAASGVNIFPNDWYNPFVRTGDTKPWPENPGPMNSPGSCDSCHGDAPDADKGFAGRLPHLSTDLPGYCGAIFRSAIGARPPTLPDTMTGVISVNPPGTMPNNSNAGRLVCTPNLPSGNPNFRACSAQTTSDCTPNYPAGDARRGDPAYNMSCTPEAASLLAWCGQTPANDAASRGDPHLTTVDQFDFDFQSAGEFTYLRGDDGLELQSRQTAVPTANATPPNAHSGLPSCVSVNTAVAARMGKHRVTYQQPPEVSKLQEPVLRVDGEPRKIDGKGISLGQSGMITPAKSGSGITLQFADGSVIVVTTNWWQNQQLWYMNVDVQKTRAREGVLGNIKPSGWLPNLSDGSSLGAMPPSLSQRFADLNGKFADSWRVTDQNSLFDYAAGQSTKQFTFPEWPPEKPDCTNAPGQGGKLGEPIDEKVAMEICSKIKNKSIFAQCVVDVAVTGERGFVNAHMISDQINR